MMTVTETRRETADAMSSILQDFARAGDRPLSKSEILESRNGDGGEFTATAVHNAILELLEQGMIEYTSDRRLQRRAA